MSKHLRGKGYATYVVALVFFVLFVLIAAQEEVQRSALDLNSRVETTKRNNRNWLRIIPERPSDILVQQLRIIMPASTKSPGNQADAKNRE